MTHRPWYATTYRWAQTNLTEIDGQTCDVSVWQDIWQRNAIQGIIVNAGGIVAYYPAEHPLQYRSKYLGDRDVYKAFSDAAKELGIRVVARMDINRAGQAFYDAHPDWFARDANGQAYTNGEHYFTCVNSDYYRSYVPGLFQEIIRKYQPDGFADNSWQGIPASQICYCDNCRSKFQLDQGLELPGSVDWDNPVYRVWIQWSMDCRLENWDLFNACTRAYGGDDCLWMGMVHANPIAGHQLYDLQAICARSQMIMTDHQSRDSLNGLEQNSLNGSLLHELAGWDCVIPESMANYVRGIYTFRRGCNPPKETQQWMHEGMAGGISPWIHFIGASQDDARQYRNTEKAMRWHKANEAFLYDRTPVADIGLVWSQRNATFYGRDRSQVLCAYPWRGMTRALTRARIAFLPVHADHIQRDLKRFKTLILPDLAVLSDDQLAAIGDFVSTGGNLIYTGATGMLDEWGNVRPHFPLDQLTGIIHDERRLLDIRVGPTSWDDTQFHTYLRLPDRDRMMSEAQPDGQARHPILQGFDETDIIPFGGQIYPVTYRGSSPMQAIATLVPPFPIYPPEFSYMEPENRQTDIPVIMAGQTPYGGKVVYFAGDIDRRYGQANLGDHGDLLANAIRWTVDGQLPFSVTAPGYLDCRLYRQEGRLLLHLVNLTHANQQPGFVEQICPLHQVEVAIAVPDTGISAMTLQVADQAVAFDQRDGFVHLVIEKLEDHELVVIHLASR